MRAGSPQTLTANPENFAGYFHKNYILSNCICITISNFYFSDSMRSKPPKRMGLLR